MLDNRIRWIKRSEGADEQGLLIYSPKITTAESTDILQSAVMTYNYESTASGSANNLLANAARNLQSGRPFTVYGYLLAGSPKGGAKHCRIQVVLDARP